jgi:hypothetical protein
VPRSILTNPKSRHKKYMLEEDHQMLEKDDDEDEKILT